MGRKTERFAVEQKNFIFLLERESLILDGTASPLDEGFARLVKLEKFKEIVVLELRVIWISDYFSLKKYFIPWYPKTFVREAKNTSQTSGYKYDRAPR